MSFFLNCLQVRVIQRLLICFVVLVCLILTPVSATEPVYHWKNVAVGAGGYVTGLVIHPKEKGLVYIRTDVGGFFRWDEPGMRWIPITDHFDYKQKDYYGGEAIAVDPNDPNVVYIAAGMSLRQGSIFKSTDRGNTWTKLNLKVPMHGNGNLRWAGERLAVDPFNSNIILFGSRTKGLFKSADGGISWRSIGFTGNTTEGIGILSILFDPTSQGRVYANVYDDGIYESVDGGESWNFIKESPSGVLRMSIDNNGAVYTAGRVVPKVAKRERGGKWEDITPLKFSLKRNVPTSTQLVLNSFNYCGISVDPANSNHIVFSLDYKMPGKMYRSRDGGASWEEVKKKLNKTVPWWQDNYWGAAMAALVIDPHNSERVWFTDWFGVWRTEDLSAEVPTWTVLAAGLEEIYAECLIAPPASSSSSGYMLLSGAFDICGLVHYDLDKFPEKKLFPTYQHTRDLDYCANDPSHIVRTGENTAMNFFGEYVVSTESETYGGATSSDQGRTWTKFTVMPPLTSRPSNVAMSATNPNIIIILSGNCAFRTHNGGNSWKKISTLPEGAGRQSLAADRVNGKKFYSYYNGKLHRSIDGGVTFRPTTAALPDESGTVKTVFGMEGEVWIGFGSKGLYRSSNSGSSFSKIQNVDEVLLFDFGKGLERASAPILYVYGTINGKYGVFRSLDFGKKWQDITPVENVGIGRSPSVLTASKQHCGLVFIGTYGRGIYYGIPDDFSKVR